MAGATMERGPEPVTHHVHHDWQRDGSVSETILDAIVVYEGEDAADLPPLERSINQDALNSIFERTEVDPGRAGSVTFSYHGYVVVVMSTGQILIRKPDAE